MDVQSNQQQYITEKIKKIGLAAGFTHCGFAGLMPFNDKKDVLNHWLETGCHAEMNYMAETLEKRLQPELLVEGARTVIVLAAPYFTDEEERRECYRIARYARGSDYHKVLKKRLIPLQQFLLNEAGARIARVFTDSAPVLEKPLAARAGLGMQGKNSLLIIPNAGSYFLLAEIFTDLELPPSKPLEIDLCGSCRKCLEACPTGALQHPGFPDARKCISYHTIESKSDSSTAPIPYHGWAFGCDICQQVCPHNRNPLPATIPELFPDPSILSLSSQEMESMTEEQFQRLFQGKAVMRAGYERFMRNIRFIQSDETDSTSRT